MLKTVIACLVALVAFTNPTLAGQDSESSVPPWMRFADEQIKQQACGVKAQAALSRGVEWLAQAQQAGGSWSVSGAQGEASMPATALALLALLGDGHTRTLGVHKDIVALGFEWLTANVSEACSSRELAMATLALAELREFEGETAEVSLEPVLRLLLDARTSEGTWSRASGEDWDVLATTWAAAAIGRVGESRSDEFGYSFKSLRRSISKRVERTGKVPVDDQGAAKERGAALLLLARVSLGADVAKEPYMERQANRLARKASKPSWEVPDLEYWFAATTALEVLGGENNKAWRGPLQDLLLEHQDRATGHWPAVGVSRERGEVRSTALAVLCLEAPYRLARLSDPSEFAQVEGGGGKFGGRRSLRSAGGSGTQEPLADALAWLARNQSKDGSWSIADAEHSVGCTGLALLAFMGDSHTTVKGQYKDVVTKGIDWLVQRQSQDTGRFGSGRQEVLAYEHAIATQAMVEAFYFSKSIILKGSALKAVEYILAARNPDGVWSYSVPPDGENDTALSVWMLMTLKSAEGAGIPIDQKVWDDCAAWFDTATDAATGRVGYRSTGGPSSRYADTIALYDPNKTEALTAVALLSRVFLGQTRKSHPVLEQHADLLLKALPEWSDDGSTCDAYYWFYGSYAMYQMGGKHWSLWNKAMKPVALGSQVKKGEHKGSWDPVGPWGKDGGRVYTTALMALILEVYFRYARVLPR